jgi:hypothetical protein
MAFCAMPTDGGGGRFRWRDPSALAAQRGATGRRAPGLVHPASTAREIAGMAQLPPDARAAFAIIATRVEASRYACALWLRMTGWPRVMPMPPLPGSA